MTNIKNKNYEVVEQKVLGDIDSDGTLLTHKKTGASIVLINNDDDNKVFYIGFRTPPPDSTGVPHILEHSVLCGSQQFPVKDPFVEMVKGSLNTFLNAMTYPDKTVYPVASCNDKDFQNLMHVYLDAVFYPKIKTEKRIFLQEGWHYELENKEDDLKINGVVYNEMKGAFSTPDDVLEREIMNSLYPATAYGVESGGDPNVIPDLTYEQFLEFHSTYYHPSNAYIYLYGNMDMEEKLKFIDEQYLSKFEQISVDSSINIQPAFLEEKRIQKQFAVQEDEENNTYLSYNLSIGNTLDEDLHVAIQILDYVLCSAQGAPLKQRLLDEGIGKDVYSTYDNGILQPYFCVIAKNANLKDELRFKAVIEEELQKIVQNKIEEKSILAAISTFEFQYREADFGSYPKGLMYGLGLLNSWLYDNTKVFMHVESSRVFDRLRNRIKEGYFEALIQTYLIENSHKSIVILEPKQGLTQIEDEQLKNKLKAYKDTLNEEQVEEIIKMTESLRAYQELEETPENLACIPMLTIDDLKKETEFPVNEILSMHGVKVLHHDIQTNGICYLKFIFEINHLTQQELPKIIFLQMFFSTLNTENYSYKDLFDEIQIVTGGILPQTNVYTMLDRETEYTITFEVKTKVLYQNLNKAIELIKEIMFTSNYHDEKRIYELIARAKSKTQAQFMSAGHSLAMLSALACSSPSMVINDMLGGLNAYRLVEQLEHHFEEEKNTIIADVTALSKRVFRPENFMIDITLPKKHLSKVEAATKSLIQQLNEVEALEAGPKFTPQLKETCGFKTSAPIQYVCQAGNFKKAGYSYTGALKVLKVMLGYEYLWQNIRVKGGAYGCMCNFTVGGNGYFVSYRDPNLEKTLDIYKGIPAYIENVQLDDRTLTQYIIGAISDLDVPKTPSSKGAYGLSAYMSNITNEQLQKERTDILETNEVEIRKLAQVVQAILNYEHICVVGNADNIDATKDLYQKVENLFTW